MRTFDAKYWEVESFGPVNLNGKTSNQWVLKARNFSKRSNFVEQYVVVSTARYVDGNKTVYLSPQGSCEDRLIPELSAT